MEWNRNESLGQVWTPSAIARKMAERLNRELHDGAKILDPACGPGTFIEALSIESEYKLNIDNYDVDERFILYLNDKFYGNKIRHKNYCDDYLNVKLSESYDAVILNPPYIRHEEINNKVVYKRYIEKELGTTISSRSNLLVYFLLKSIIDLKPGGYLTAIVYDAIEHTVYGRSALEIIETLMETVECEGLLTPFDGALVDAKIYLMRKRIEKKTFSLPKESGSQNELVPLSSLLTTVRGTSFVKRAVFFAQDCDPYYEFSEDILVKVGTLKTYQARPDKRAYLLSSESEYGDDFKNWLSSRAEQAGKKGVKLTNKKVNNKILFNYYLRNKPKHIWNVENTYVSDNFYASTPLSDFPAEVAWLLMNSDLFSDCLLRKARNQGNGLFKLQLFEYKDALIPNWNLLNLEQVLQLKNIAEELIKTDAMNVNQVANECIRKYFNGISAEI